MSNENILDHTYSSIEIKQRHLWTDVILGLRYLRVMFLLANISVRKRYRRTTLGPLWIVVTNLFFGLLVGLLYSGIFNKPFLDFFLYLYVGYTIWVYLSDIFVSSFSLYQREYAMMSQRPFPISSYALKFMFEKTLIFAHNFPVIVIVFCLHGFSFIGVLEFILALFMLTILGYFYAISAGILGARFADLQQIASNIVRIIFFLTPIIWSVDSVSSNLRAAFVIYNPFYHMIEVVRAPLLGAQINQLSLLVVSLGCLFFFVTASVLFKRYKHTLIYWLG